MSKKIVAMLMAVAMAFSLLPVTVLAEENKPVAKVGDVTYTSLDAAVEAAKNTDDAIIDVLADCTTAGLNLSKDLTIQGAESLKSKPTITFNDKGIALWGKALTFKDCNVVMNGIGSTPYTAEWNWMTVSASKNASLSLDGATMTMDGTGTAKNVHAIYFGTNNELNLSKGSELKIENYNQDALEWDGGDGGYNVNIKDSTYTSDNNRSGFTGTFYATIDNSTVEVINSRGNGSNVTFNDNGNWGISAWRIDMTNKSTLTAMDNGYSGVWTRVLNVDSTCTLDVERNGTKASKSSQNPGIFFQGNGKHSSKIEEGANVTIKNNAGSGIYTYQEACNLTIESATITNNGLGTVNASKIGADKGGGIYNVGTMTLGKNVVIYNNHAQNAGDDIYNTGTITFGDVGEGWVLDDCDHDINGWYDDGSGYSDGMYSRWAAHTYPSYISQFSEFDEETGLATLDYEVALKAAHDVIQEDPIQPDNDRAHSKSKEATNLVKQSDGTYTSDVTLTLPSVEEAPVYDVVFVLDKSTSATLKDQAKEMLQKLQNQIAGTQTTIKVGVVIFDQKAKTTKLIDLTTGYTELENAIQQTTSSGTNTHAGLLAGKALLDNDTDVAADHKYLIFVSDGITYMYNAEPTAIALQGGDQTKTDGSDAFAGPDNWSTKYGSNDAPNNWKTWLEGISTLIQTDEDIYELPYAQTASGLQKTKWLPYTEKMNHATAVDKALYLTNETYQSAKTAGYHCYAMEAEGTAGTAFPWGPSFMNYLAGGKEVSFEDIHNDIYYLLSEGSTVEDVIGYGTDNRGNAYNFDFVNDISKLTLKVGTETLEATDLSLDLSYDDANETARYGFAPNRVQITTDTDQSNIPEQDPYSYGYVLHYYQNGKNGKSDECFVWDINVPVSKFAPVSLTYQVKLTNAQTSSGTYGTYDKNGSQNKDSLYTNKSATLYPVDSDGVCGIPENFQKPTVSYTVSGGNSGGNNGGNSKPSLNTKDHYGYIIGYPVDYYTGQPTTDQTKKPVRPEGKITRAEVATIYFRMLTDESRTKFWSQSSGYSDVKTGDWFNNAVSTLSNAGIIAGYEDGSFRPNGYITRAEFATIAARFFDVTYSGKDLFPDISGHWAKDYINQAANKGFVNGYEDGTFKPDRNITRAEAVTLVNRTLDRHPDKNHFTKDMLVWPDNMDQTKWYYADMQEATNSHTYQMKENSDKTKYENWTKTLSIRNWEALEKAWSNANSSQGNGNVV